MKRKSTWIAAVSAAVLLIVCLAVPTAVHSGRSAAVTPGTPAQEAGTPGSTVDRNETPGSADAAPAGQQTAAGTPQQNGVSAPKNTVPKNSFPSAEQVNVTQEIVLTSTADYTTPYTEAAIDAVFTGPNGQTMTVPGFWDGEKTWRIRFAAPQAGTWTYETFCTNTADTGLHGQKGTLKVSAYTGDNELIARGRLRVSDDKTYLTYGDGTPFFWLADTHWFAFSQREKLNFSNNKNYKSMFKGTVDQRAEEGYTAYQAILWVTATWDALGLYNEGGMQWEDGALWEKLNPGFWQNVDRRLTYIVERGMTPVVGFDWTNTLTSANLENYKRIVRYVIARYSSYPIVWNMSGEYNATSQTVKDAHTLDNYGRLGQYVSEVDPYGTLETVHACYNVVDDFEHPQYAVDYFRGQEWLDFVMSEGGHYTHFDAPVYNDWDVYNNAEYQIPWLEAEAKYEDIWEIPTAQTREIAYLSIMNGSLGYSYGAEGGWQSTWNSQDTYQTYGRLPTPWHKALNKVVGAKHMTYMKNYFTSLPWWELKLDKTSVKWSAERDDHSVLRPTVNTTADMRAVTVYYPLNSFEDNYDLWPEATGVLSGLDPKKTYKVTWFDTQSGEYTTVDGKMRPDANGRYTLPQPKDSKTHDWMLTITENGAASIDQEYARAAARETNGRVLPMHTGERSLPEMSLLDKNAVLIDLGKARGTQGEDGLWYYSYDRVTEEYSELPRVQLPYWGEFTWQSTAGEFITDNLFCGGPTKSAAIVWVAPADGKLEISSRPKWSQLYQGNEGAVVTYMLGDEKLEEFVFDTVNVSEGQLMTTVEVKAGDRLTIMTRAYQGYNIMGNQVGLNTQMYFTADGE